jgi:hypothetical protein
MHACAEAGLIAPAPAQKLSATLPPAADVQYTCRVCSPAPHVAEHGLQPPNENEYMLHGCAPAHGCELGGGAPDVSQKLLATGVFAHFSSHILT